MSFILDALKKSETERQEQGAAEFSRVPASSGNANPARWLWLLAALLLVNFAVLLAVLLKPDADPASPVSQPAPATANSATVVTAEPPVASESASRFADQVASAVREQRPAASAPASPADLPADIATPASPPRRAATTNSVPSLEELRLRGAINVAELHLDIHVFSEDPAARFVFINMDKHREGETIDEGPVVREITSGGVILEYQGQEFLLSRQ